MNQLIMNACTKVKPILFLLLMIVLSCTDNENSRPISTITPDQENAAGEPAPVESALTTCEVCNTGLFQTSDFNWNTVGNPVTLPNGTTISSIAPNSLSVSKNGTNQLFNAGNNGRVHYYNWGTPANFLAILVVNAATSGHRSIVIVNTESPQLSTTLIYSGSAPSTAALPVINHCLGKGGAIIVKASNGNSLSAFMCTSDNGTPLCNMSPFVPTGQILGNSTATKFEILYQGSPQASYIKTGCTTPPPTPPANCIDCNAGSFISNNFSWHTAANVPITLPNGTIIKRTGASSLSVSKSGTTKNFSALNNGQVHYYKWGTPANFLAILTVNGGTTGLRSLFIVNTNSSLLNTTLIYSATLASTNSLPIINYCAGKGSAIITKVINAPNSMTASIRTSDNGTLLCTTQPYVPNFNTTARTTATQLQILYNGFIKTSYNRSECSSLSSQ